MAAAPAAPRPRTPRGDPSNASAPPSSASTRSAAGRQRSSRCSATITAVPHSSLIRRSTPSSSSPATGSSCEVGSSSSSTRGLAGERGAERHALQLAAGQLARRAVEQRRDAERERGLLDAARDRGRAPAAVLERERELGAHGRHHDLRLRVLEQRPGDGGELGRSVLARVEPVAAQPARERAAVEVRHEAGGGAQERRLAGARPAGEHDELAGLDSSASRRAAPAPPRPDTCT